MTTPPIQFADNPRQHRVEAHIDGQLAGFVAYESTHPQRLVHTEVLPAFEGRGVGSALARQVLDGARSRGEQVVPACSFIAGWIARHPDYADVVAG